MDRRTLLAALGTLPVASAGCLAPAVERPSGAAGTTEDAATETRAADGSPVVEHFDGEVSRPECRREVETVDIGDESHEFETAETVPYPDAPTGFSRDDAPEYVEAFEHAYVTKRVLCDGSSGHVFRISYSVLAKRVFDWYDDVTVVFLRRIGAASAGSDGSGNVWETDVDSDGVVYAVDESGAARAGFPEVHTVDADEFEARAPDPLETGELVAVFE